MGRRMQLLIHRCPNENLSRVQKAWESPLGERNPPNESIQVGGGRESNRDSPSIGERKGNRSNRMGGWKSAQMWCCGLPPILLTCKSNLVGTPGDTGWQPRRHKRECYERKYPD